MMHHYFLFPLQFTCVTDKDPTYHFDSHTLQLSDKGCYDCELRDESGQNELQCEALMSAL